MTKKHPKTEHLRDYAKTAYEGDDDEIAGFLRDKADVIDQQDERIRELEKTLRLIANNAKACSDQIENGEVSSTDCFEWFDAIRLVATTCLHGRR